MELEKMSIEELETRKAQIAVDCEAEGADLDALTEEVRGINQELENRRSVEAQKAEIRAKVAEGAGVVVERLNEEKGKPEMTIEEVRASKEYVDAFANYIKTGDDKECRTLLTTNASGVVPVPVLVDSIVRTAWEKNDILNRVRKTNFRGNLKVAFEASASGAVAHTEGTSASSEESLSIGIVTMTPKNIKKWIRLSDEAVAMGGEEFLRYIYDELTYQILKKLSEDIVAKIVALSTSNSTTAVGAKTVTAAPGQTTIAEAYANLSDEASNPVIIMNKATYADFIAAAAAGNFAWDPFMGLPVLFSSALPTYSAATAGSGKYAIVGDLGVGYQVNYPEGEGVVIKYDDLSLAEADLVKIVGRQYAAHDAVAPFAFCRIIKPSA